MFYTLEKIEKNGVRRGEVKTPHGIVHTPIFMPVGTQGSVKGISPDELKELGAEIILANTYHLYLRPGEKTIKKLGGLHKFAGWKKPILTDSGGYQVFSLGENKFKNKNEKIKMKEGDTLGNHSLVKILDDGVEFKSYLDGSKHLFTPEKVIDIQLDLGVDILMPLDVCPSGKATKKEIERATELTIEWAKRAKRHFDNKIVKLLNGQSVRGESNLTMKQFSNNSPALFGIVQGGLDEKLRKYCTDELIKLNFDGYAVGGLAVDHETRDMWQTVKLMGQILTEDKPRYLMGVGTPNDIKKAMFLGMDMFDCVLPTRLGRHGSVYIKCQISNVKYQKFELINLLNSKYRGDPEIIEKDCECYACRGGFSRAYISHLIRSGEMFGMRLATMHNLFIYLNLLKKIQTS